jgi:hypothetical protein
MAWRHFYPPLDSLLHFNCPEVVPNIRTVRGNNTRTSRRGTRPSDLNVQYLTQRERGYLTILRRNTSGNVVTYCNLRPVFWQLKTLKSRAQTFSSPLTAAYR